VRRIRVAIAISLSFLAGAFTIAMALPAPARADLPCPNVVCAINFDPPELVCRYNKGRTCSMDQGGYQCETGLC